MRISRESLEPWKTCGSRSVPSPLLYDEPASAWSLDLLIDVPGELSWFGRLSPLLRTAINRQDHDEASPLGVLSRLARGGGQTGCVVGRAKWCRTSI